MATDRSLAHYRILEEKGPFHPALARRYALMGRRAEALKAIEAFQPRSPTAAEGQGTVELAFAYAALGDKNRAFEWLEKGIERRDFMVFIKVDPKLDPSARTRASLPCCAA